MLALAPSELALDGHMAIMLSTDTDPYFPCSTRTPWMREELRRYLRAMVRRCLKGDFRPQTGVRAFKAASANTWS